MSVSRDGTVAAYAPRVPTTRSLSARSVMLLFSSFASVGIGFLMNEVAQVYLEAAQEQSLRVEGMSDSGLPALAASGVLLAHAQVAITLTTGFIWLGWGLLGASVIAFAWVSLRRTRPSAVSAPADLRASILRTMEQLESYERKVVEGQVQSAQARQERKELEEFLTINASQLAAVRNEINPNRRRRTIYEALGFGIAVLGLVLTIVQMRN